MKDGNSHITLIIQDIVKLDRLWTLLQWELLNLYFSLFSKDSCIVCIFVKKPLVILINK